MVVGLDLNLSFRRTDLLRDLERGIIFLINGDTFVQRGEPVRATAPEGVIKTR